MSTVSNSVAGTVVSLWRYPVKSMMGEELTACPVSERGLLGDRAYALLDKAEGKVATAKNPRKWGKLFGCRAAFIEPPSAGENAPPVRIMLADGTIVTSGQSDLDRLLSDTLAREVNLATTAPERGTSEQYWPEIEGHVPVGEPVPNPYGDTVTSFPIALAAPPGAFFDYATIHLLTTATLDRLRELYPQGRFEPRRFRPNIIVEPTSGQKNFVENAWVGHTLAIGDQVRLKVTDPCPRCVMTTLAQGDLPRDPGILRTIARHNQPHIPVIGKAMPSVGIYAVVARGGTIRRGDRVTIQQ